ncbi:MAG: hypothetical protein JXQ73_12535 [Phycisphaerae bacterium]|nr:hypothetical protein [Phycisphaerae bacterium]
MRSQLAKIALSVVALWYATPALSVTVEMWEEDEPKAFEQGKCEQTVISSLGRVLLGREETEILAAGERADFVNALAQNAEGVIYAATGPNGVVYRIVKEKAEVLCAIEGESNLFSLLIGADGNLLVGTGGAVGRIYKVTQSGKVSVWFDPNKTVPKEPEKKKDEKDGKPATATASTPASTSTAPASKPSATSTPSSAPTTSTGPAKHKSINYIWAMARGQGGQVYAATGAEGWLLEISADGKTARVVFDSKESNLLSLAIDKNGLLYAGSDTRGLVYRIEPKRGKAYVLYDTGEAEVSSIALDKAGNVYAATAAAAGARPGKTAKPKPAGRPGTGAASTTASGRKSSSAPTRRTVQKPVPGTASPIAAAAPEKTTGNAVYRIAPDGTVTEVFREPVMILDMVEADGTLYLGTGNEGRVYQVRPEDEEQIMLAKLKDKQVTAILRAKDGRVHLGTSNEARLVKLSSGYAGKGTFVSRVLDAKQISRWGRLYWEGERPGDTGVTVSTRSGNVSDPEEGTWDDWSKEFDAREGGQIPSPTARFLQYRLTLTSTNDNQTPRVRVVRAARQADNQHPKVTAIEVAPAMRVIRAKTDASQPGSQGQTPLPPGTLPTTRIIKWKAEDPNGDRLLYDIYFRLTGQKRWILLKEDNKTTEHKWDTCKVPDGRYEIRLVAKDAPSNPPLTALATDRISDPVVVDNAPPVIDPAKATVTGKGRARINAVIVDKHSLVAGAHYAVDSHDKWVAVLAEDDLFDSLRETISFELEGLEPGEHVVTIRARDEQYNVGYTTIVVTLDQ